MKLNQPFPKQSICSHLVKSFMDLSSVLKVFFIYLDSIFYLNTLMSFYYRFLSSLHVFPEVLRDETESECSSGTIE